MIYVTSDLHGYSLEKFIELLKTVHFSDEDYCFILGDVIDRGEDGIAILKWLTMQPNVEMLLGNHELMMLSNMFLFEEVTDETVEALDEEQMETLSVWMENGGQPTLQALSKCDSDTIDSILLFLKSLTVYKMITVNGRQFFLSHSGLMNFEKGKSLDDYSLNDFLWNRPYLDDEYFDDAISVFGHTPTGIYGSEFRGKILKTRTWIDVDVGTTAGFAPALLRLDDLQEFYLE